ncbi:sigma-70 family RNA polymerase sigma factor [Paenibacillus sp. JSM ZJ436]|uniref:sigma-70 family RNA polymerase sigma factor n=1 Tax=Paenibacillus sp. JSM ZJ436 TaxID=3376190 RepID=UPI0037B6644A
MEERTYSDLAGSACLGSETAFAELMSLLRRRMYSIACSYLRNEEDALKVLQETVERAWTGCGRLRKPELFTPWIIAILIRCCADEQKVRRRGIPTEQIYSDNHGKIMSDRDSDLEQRLERMKPKYRHVLMLRYAADLTAADIAAVLKCPEDTVNSRLHQGLKLLQLEVQPGGVFRHA